MKKRKKKTLVKEPLSIIFGVVLIQVIIWFETNRQYRIGDKEILSQSIADGNFTNINQNKVLNLYIFITSTEHYQ